MIKFFRRVRYNYLKENRFSRYLIYAIGEIILLVIGILIALQVNNGNIKRIEDRKEQQLIHKLLLQTEGNIKKINDEAEFYKYVETVSDSILKVLRDKNTEVTKDALTTIINSLSFDYHLNLDVTTLQEARENGTISLLKNSDLRETIYDFENQYQLLVQREKIINADLQNHFMPFLYQNYNFAEYISGFEYLISETPEKTPSQIIDHLVFKNFIVVRKIYLSELMDHIQLLKNQLEELQKLLAEEKYP